MMSDKPSIRTGIGYDLHKMKEGNPLYLGGVQIPFHAGPIAHSDGDVLVHALGDACLGAAGEGDLGTFFSPEKEQWAGVSGEELAREIVNILQEKSFQIYQVDSVLLVERPKIAPYRADMISNLSSYFRIPESNIGLKATTNEGLGPVGKGKAIASWGNVLLRYESVSS